MAKKSGYNKKRFVPLSAAKIIIAQFNLSSRSAYWKWHKKEKPIHIPKYPNRTYPEWISWNDFLDNDNSFEKELDRKRKLTRGYWEAVRWVQKQKYKTQYDYKDAYERGDVPDDIPKSPNQFYSEWAGWGVWLGSTARTYVMSKSENLNMVAFCKISTQAGNIFEVVYSADGVAALQESVAVKTGLTPYAVYHVAQGEEKPLADLLDTLASNQGGNMYLSANLHELNFQLDNLLQKYVPGS